MDARALANIAVRIWGVLLLFGCVAPVPGVLLLSAGAFDAESAAVVRGGQHATLVGLLVGAAIATCLIVWSRVVAHALVPKSEPLQLGVSAPQLQRLAFAVVGLVTVIAGLRDAALAAFTLHAKPEWAEVGRFEYLWSQQPEAAIRAVVELVVGVLLIVGWDRLARASRLLAGTHPDDETEERAGS